MMFERLHIRTVVQLHRLDMILKSAQIVKPPHAVGIGSYEYGLPDIKTRIPSLVLVLSSVGHHLRQTNNVQYWGDRTRSGVVIQEAPPRVQAAAAALLRPLQHLNHLVLYDMKFKTLTQLLGVIRAQPQIQSVELHNIQVLQATERFHWPPSLTLENLQRFFVEGCRVPTNSILTFLSFALAGNPNFLPSPTGVTSHYWPQCLGGPKNSCGMHSDDVNALRQIVQALGRHLCSPLNHADSPGTCILNISPDWSWNEPELSGEVY